MKSISITSFFLFATYCLPVGGQTQQTVESFPLSQIRLTDSPFYHAQQMDMCYLLGLDADRLAAPYLKGAGIQPKAENYPNWENTGLDGHIGGHYLSALAYMYASTGDARIKERLDYMLSELKRAQDASGDGYLCGTPGGEAIWKEIRAGNIRAQAFSLNDRWVPLYNIHKTYAGLRDAYLETGSETAKQMLVKLTDWMIGITANLTDEQMQDMLRSDHGGLNEVFADVAAITNDDRYLKLAHRFSHQLVLQPLLNGEDKLTGMHANTQIPKVIGFKRIADLEDNKAWSGAADYFWHNVVDHRTVSIGGNSVDEHFHAIDNFDRMLHSEQGVETCNTYNMLRLTAMLYRTTADASYMDYYERALYNHILSSQDPVQGGLVYFTPMRSGHYRVYSQPQTSFWCCVGSGMENHARYGEMIYGKHNGDLYVNLFIPSTLDWKQRQMTIAQCTGFPNEAGTTLTITSGKQQAFTIRFRLPAWTKQWSMTVNGQPVTPQIEQGYAALNRKWKAGDTVKLSLPMQLEAIQLPDHSPNYSFAYGPIVLAADMGKENQTGLFADESRGGHIAHGARLPLTEAPTLVGTADSLLAYLQPVADKPLTYTLTHLYPARYKQLTLQPFYTLHECRYTLYFPLVTPKELEQHEQELARQEAQRMALDAITIDKVVCGEQQPESDHFVESEQSTTGADDETGQRWRAARSWFSYRMKADGKANTLYIVCQSSERSDARILINGEVVGALTPESDLVEIAIPAQYQQGEIVVRIEKDKAFMTPRCAEVRLIKR
ncbi:MAG: glycoside hydrolase family 127 protein [Prevotellaceae bacterium]|jgi:DUF1680 family protein|nr:glycoside hydrolase family 127 protein [Prevotellaceae bacterium]